MVFCALLKYLGHTMMFGRPTCVASMMMWHFRALKDSHFGGILFTGSSESEPHNLIHQWRQCRTGCLFTQRRLLSLKTNKVLHHFVFVFTQRLFLKAASRDSKFESAAVFRLRVSAETQKSSFTKENTLCSPCHLGT